MINSKDIMIGNWFSHNEGWNFCGHKGYFQFTESDWYAIGECTLFLEDADPIPLTEEILLKCGFERIDIFAEYRKGNIILGLVIGDENQYQLMINGFCTSVILNYLHELQNVYKIFEKQELEIKL